MTKNTTPLLSNLPIEKLTSETDFLNILDKGTLIKDFLIGSQGNLKDIKMYALYGDWGSGKSSLMKYLEKELRGEFNTFFFEAWEFEKDENLAMSLLEFITYKSNSTSEKFYDGLVKYGGRILRGLAKSVKVNIPLFVNGPSIEINPSALAEELNQKDPITFFQALDGFKTEFRRLEDYITGEQKPKYNIVFIDDLDRCEPEQVLNLMSAIKLFFTYGEKTLFFCGIDKQAVEAAVKTKYGDVVKSNEYLEKIFDISFTMPKHNDVQKLINHYFDETTYRLDILAYEINNMVHTFFDALEFKNPRRIKKVLNKYQILREFIRIKKSEDYLTPNIDMKDGVVASHFETLLVLYLIILHEFYPTEFDNFLNFEKIKKVTLNSVDNRSSVSEDIKAAAKDNYSKDKLDSIIIRVSADIERFNICLFPSNIDGVNGDALAMDSWSHIIADGNNVDYLFYKYINPLNPGIWLDRSGNASLQDIKRLIKNLL
ncbi:P-loop NTPase fold protein [Flavobacterium sp. CAU 1735]|uniref:KAP family P-loop NTPase fold protein n=1 Tax=Flavobacterium sp. CAU 1735 TaxID=3140361 RepID=UPI003260A410